MSEEETFTAYKLEDILVIFSDTPLYPGGEREESIIDLTVQRDPLKNLPIIRATSIKGSLRSLVHLSKGENYAKIIFGSEEKAGEILLLDANILLYPVRSDIEPLVFTTSPLQINDLNRFLSMREDKKEKSDEIIRFEEEIEEGTALAPQGSPLVDKTIEIFDEIPIHVKGDEAPSNLANWVVKKLPDSSAYDYIKRKIKENLIIVNESTFQHIVERGLIRITRIRLKYETKTVESGALFTQELIPPYTIFFAGILVTKRKLRKESEEFLNSLRKGIRISLGGDETTGKGLVFCRL